VQSHVRLYYRNVTSEACGQPAVELGKEAAFALIGKAGYETLASQLQPVAEVDSGFMV